MRVAVWDEHAVGFTWVLDEAFARASHALVDDGHVWLVDPVDVPEAVERAAGLGTPAGVLQLLDRHRRDCAAIAARLGVPHLRLPDAVPATAMEVIRPVDVPGWREVALWWPRHDALVVAEVVGANAFYTGGAGRVGMHPLLRAWAPGGLRGLRPRHLLMGHGPAVHGSEAGDELERAHRRARRDLHRVVLRLPFATR